MEPAEEGETITESSPLEDDPWEYPRSKIETERLIAAEHGDIPALILRIAGVYDAEGHSLPIGQHIARIHEKQPESYFFPGNPQHGTPYVHLEDLMDCFRRAVDRRHELPPLATLLVAEPDLVRHEELQELIGERIHGKEWPSIRIPRVAAKAGAWAKETIGEGPDSFVKPWMVDLAGG